MKTNPTFTFGISIRAILLSIWTALMMISCGPHADDDDDDDHDHDEYFFHVSEAQMALAGIELGEPAFRTIQSTITVNGVVEVPPGSLADISAPLGGFVRRAEYYEGAFVKKGTVLVTLEHPEYIRMQQAYLETQSEWVFADKDFKRAEKLYTGHAAAEKAIDQARSTRDLLAARLAGLAGQLRIAGIDPASISAEKLQPFVYLKAPFDGFITFVGVNLGKQVGPEEVLYQLMNPAHLHLELQAFPGDAALIQVGQTLQYKLQGTTGWSNGHVVLVGQSVNPQTRTVRVHAHPDDHEKRLRPGTFIQARIAISADSVLTLPEEAFRQEEGEWLIFIKEADGFRGIPVETGLRGNGFVEVKNLSQKGPFVVKGAYYLAEVEEDDHDH
jgi:cobalt-zinc-cadmium efflux system membrane fusion protein